MQEWMTKAHKQAKREGQSVFITVTYTKVHFSFKAPTTQESYYEVTPDGMGRRWSKQIIAEGTAFEFVVTKEASVLAAV